MTEYKIQISNKKDGGKKYRLTNVENNKVSIFHTKSDADKLFNFLFQHAIKKII